MAYFERTQITNASDTLINPGTDESLILIRRIAKLLEPSSIQDSGGRQRVTVDTLPAITIAASQTLGTVTTVGAVTAITNALPTGANLIGYIGMIGDTRLDLTRNTYSNSIRRNLTFT